MKSTCIILLISVVLQVSCKKDTPCETCSADKVPLAVAGPDQFITLPADSVMVDGSLSSDPDGTIARYQWSKVSGPVSAVILSPAQPLTRIKNLVEGTYFFELKVTDNKGLSGMDTVRVTVNANTVANRPPIARAGADQDILLPTNMVTLNGNGSTDPDNNIASYAWTKIAGPSSFTIANAGAIQTQVTNLAEGTYQFELKVTDVPGLVSRDTVQVGVRVPAPTCTDCKIVFVSNRDGNEEIYTCKADGSNVIRLTYDPGIDREPVWSPDGTRIAFVSNRTGTYELYIMDANGANVTRKTSAVFAEYPAWSPDGTRIAYAQFSNGSQNIWQVPATGGMPSLLFEAPGWDCQPSWSPDGSKLAVVSDWAAYDLVTDIYTIKSDGTNFTSLTGNIFDQMDYLFPSWSPDGSRLAFITSLRTGVDTYDTKIGLMNSGGGSITVIPVNVLAGTKIGWSPDGGRIAFTKLSGARPDICWVSPDGTATGTIVTNGWDADWQR